MVTSLSAVPAAFVGGLVIDECCLMWNEDPNKRYCIRYDNQKLALILAVICELLCA